MYIVHCTVTPMTLPLKRELSANFLFFQFFFLVVGLFFLIECSGPVFITTIAVRPFKSKLSLSKSCIKIRLIMKSL